VFKIEKMANGKWQMKNDKWKIWNVRFPFSIFHLSFFIFSDLEHT